MPTSQPVTRSPKLVFLFITPLCRLGKGDCRVLRFSGWATVISGNHWICQFCMSVIRFQLSMRAIFRILTVHGHCSSVMFPTVGLSASFSMQSRSAIHSGTALMEVHDASRFDASLFGFLFQKRRHCRCSFAKHGWQ